MKQLVIRIFLNEMLKAAKNVHFVVINVSLEQGSPTLFVSRIPQGICPLHAKKNWLFYDEILDSESWDFVVKAIEIRVNEFLATQ